MMDDWLNLWLIEVNTNPCLSMVSPVTQAIIPNLINNVFGYPPLTRLAVDPVFCPGWGQCVKKGVPNFKNGNEFELIYCTK